MKARAWLALAPLLVACGDIIVAPNGGALTSVPSVDVSSDVGDSGVSTLENPSFPFGCPEFEPEGATTAILPYADGGADDENGPQMGPTECTAGGACEYGSSPDPDCNHTYLCKAEVWARSPTGGACFEAACPDSSMTSDSLNGASCTLPDSNDAAEAICNVADGTCACTTGPGNGITHPREWACTKTALDCPLHRPTIGSTCSLEGAFCDYGSCTSKRSPAVECVSGAWTETTTSCD